MSSRIARYSTRLIEACWLAAVIVTPLFFNVWSNRVFEPDKLTLMRSLALGILAASTIRLFEQGLPGVSALRAWLRRPFVRPVLLLSAAYLLSSLASFTPWLSLTGSYVRMQGLYTWLSYVVIFLAVVSLLEDARQLERLQMALILPSLPVALYGVVQKYGADPMPWLGDVTQRVASTMGNSIFVAAYLILVLPLTLARLLEALRALDASDEAGAAVNAAVLRVAGYLVLVAVQIGAIVLSGSRGPWLGILGGLFFMFLTWAVLRGQRRLLMGVLGLGLAAALFLVVFNMPQSPLASLRDLPYLGRLGQVFQTESGTGKVRLLIWGGAIELIESDPLRAVIGWGPESMHVAYNPFYPPELGDYEARNASPDRSHNETYDALVQLGLLGFLAYMALFTSLFANGLRWLGLIADRRQMTGFLGLWIGGGLATVAGFHLWSGVWTYSGVALPAGMVAGLLAFVTLRALQGFEAPDRPGQLLMVALLAGLIAHFIEIHFGIAIAATRTLFFVMAATLAVVGGLAAERPALLTDDAFSAEEEEPARKRRRRAARPERETSMSSTWTWIAAGCLMLALLVTLLYDFIVDPAMTGTKLLILFWLVGLTWLIGSLILGTETYLRLAAARVPGGGRVGLGAYLMLSLGMSLVYAVSHWGLLAADPRGADTSAGLYVMYYLALLLLLLGWAWVMSRLDPDSGRFSTRGAAAWAYPLVGLSALVLAFLTNINEVRADIYYKQAWAGYHAQAGATGNYAEAMQYYDSAIADYDRALALDPNEDYYLLFKGKALLEQAAREAAAFDQKHADSIGSTEGFSEYSASLSADAEQRDAMFERALVVLERALAVAPHNPDHTANIARAYQIWGDSTHDLSRRAERLAESKRWFERVIAADLSPNNAGLREELATTLFLAGDDAGALERVDEALAIDSKYTRPLRLRARIHREQGDFEAAETDYQAYLDSRDGRRDIAAWSELAWIRGQQGDLEGAKQANETALELSIRDEGRADLTTLSNLAILARDMKDLATACDYVQQGMDLSMGSDATINALNDSLGCGVEPPPLQPAP